MQGLKIKEKEDIKKLLLSKKLTIQEIAQILDVPLEMVKEIEASLKKQGNLPAHLRVGKFFFTFLTKKKLFGFLFILQN